MSLNNTVVFSQYDLLDKQDPVKFIYEELLDLGAPISANGSLDPGVDGFCSWTVSFDELCFSWGVKNVENQ